VKFIRRKIRSSVATLRYDSASIDHSPWDISPDGKRFLMMKEPEAVASAGGSPRKINIVLNWTEELKQRVPVK